MKHLPVGTAVAPAAVREARPHEPHRPAPVTPVAVEDNEELLTIRHGLHVPCEGILQSARGRRIPARENVLLVAYGGRHPLLGRADEPGEQRRGGLKAKSHTMPPSLV